MVDASSYTAASAFPSKLLHNKVVEKGKINPIHIQITPTNTCNLHCSFCSCDDVDKKKSISYEKIEEIFDICSKYGTKAATITGGGEPLIHPKINEIIRYAGKKGIECGLVTNGTLLKKLEPQNNLTWCRISCSDDRKHDADILEYAIKNNPKTDWAFSYVVTRKPDYSNINTLIGFANKWKFSHIRLVSDLFDLENVPDMEEIKKNIHLDDNLVIYQGRKDSTRGDKNCYISLLKPVICPEGMFGCCGIQYSIHGQKKDMIKEMRMCKLDEIKETYKHQKIFNGSTCDVCFYSQYNDSLSKILNKPEHVNFV